MATSSQTRRATGVIAMKAETVIAETDQLLASLHDPAEVPSELSAVLDLERQQRVHERRAAVRIDQLTGDPARLR